MVTAFGILTAASILTSAYALWYSARTRDHLSEHLFEDHPVTGPSDAPAE